VEAKGKWNVGVQLEDLWGTLNATRESKVVESIIPVSRSFKIFLSK